jgi:hypothetical protein
VHAAAEDEVFAQVERLGEAGAGASADDDRLDLGEVAFLVIGEAEVELLAGDQAEDRVAEELHPLVRRQARVGPGGVRQRTP